MNFLLFSWLIFANFRNFSKLPPPDPPPRCRPPTMSPPEKNPGYATDCHLLISYRSCTLYLFSSVSFPWLLILHQFWSYSGFYIVFLLSRRILAKAIQYHFAVLELQICACVKAYLKWKFYRQHCTIKRIISYFNLWNLQRLSVSNSSLCHWSHCIMIQ